MIVIQDRLVGNHCYGCGKDNPSGLRIKSHWDGNVAVCRYTPRPEQCAGPTNYLYGGTIASVIDCHSVGTAIAHFYASEGREVGEGAEIWCVTGKLAVSYLKPTPIDAPVEMTARVVESSERKAVVHTSLASGGTVTAEAQVIAVRVPEDWRAGSA
ncbi:MAG: PaaI family thioesterase [Pseudomonadota bacterium]